MNENAYPEPQEMPGRRNSYVNYEYNTPSIVKIRLDAQHVIKQCEMFLRGTREIIVQMENGDVSVQEESYGEPLANTYGVQSIILSLTSSLNAQVVQGNYDRYQYGQYVCDKRIALVCAIVSNQIKWGVKDEHINWIVDTIMESVEPFMSRLIDNKERESYSTYSTSDTIMKDTRQGSWFNMFSGGGK